MDLKQIKSSLPLLLAELNLDAPGKHRPCPFHGGSDSLAVYQQNDTAYWKCYAGCGEGTIVDARRIRGRYRSDREAIASLSQELGLKLPSPTITEPVLDLARAERFIFHARDTLQDRLDIQQKWMIDKRHITLDTCLKFCVGFLPEFKLQYYKPKPWTLYNAWVLPLIDATGAWKAVKLHFEQSLDKYPRENHGYPIKGMKNSFAPFGTQPPYRPATAVQSEVKPRHAWLGLWPPPEFFPMEEWIVLCPGELKALSAISRNWNATSITTGEAAKLPASELSRLKDRKVFIVYDNDAAGIVWRDTVVDLVRTVAIETKSAPLKRKNVVELN